MSAKVLVKRLVEEKLGQAGIDCSGIEVAVGTPKDPAHGDYATGIAMQLAKPLKAAPRQIAERIREALREVDEFESVEIAGPGFVNIRLARAFLENHLEALHAAKSIFDVHKTDRPKKIQVEFVSANPTGPLTVGHGRNASLGDGLYRLLTLLGHRVEREYYYNDAGNQMKILGRSVLARALNQPLPEDGYQGGYIGEIGERARREFGNALNGPEGLKLCIDLASKIILEDILRTLKRMNVWFDTFELETKFNPRPAWLEDRPTPIVKDSAIDKVLTELHARGLVAEHEGAQVLLGASFNLPKDPVLVRSNGEATYRLPDVAYHIDKLRRGFDLMVVVLGADHIDEHREVLHMLRALGHDTARIHGIIYQFVTLLRDGKPVKMSTRKANYVTLDELLDEVGPEATRYFFLMRKSDTHLEFDMDLARKQSQDNPLYYVQYAYARIAGIFRTAAERNIDLRRVEQSRIQLSGDPAAPDRKLARVIIGLGDALDDCERNLDVAGLLHYLRDLAEAFHTYYTAVRVIDQDDLEGSIVRLRLAAAVKRILAETLEGMGFTAPDRM